MSYSNWTVGVVCLHVFSRVTKWQILQVEPRCRSPVDRRDQLQHGEQVADVRVQSNKIHHTSDLIKILEFHCLLEKCAKALTHRPFYG